MAPKNNALRLATATANCDCCFMESHCWPGIEAHSGEVHVKREPTLMPEHLLWREGALFNGLYFAGSGFDQAKGAALLESGGADAIVYGKLFIANPDLPRRFRDGLALAEGDSKTHYSKGPAGYTDYPPA